MFEKLNLLWVYATDSADSPQFWKALVAFAMSAGIAIDTQQQQAIIALGLAIMGCLHAWQHHSDKSDSE